MIELLAQWNQPCRGLAGASTLHLGVRMRPGAGLSSLPVHGLVLLDTSTSMDGVKMENACRAVRALWDGLKPGDRLSLVTFATRVTPVMPWSEKGRTPDSEVVRALSECKVGGVTRLDLGLPEAVRRAAECPADEPRFVWLVTDGNPTGATGRPVAEHGPYLEAAAAAARGGVTVAALGLGDAAFYRAELLNALSNRGSGAFCYAPDPDKLAETLAEQLGQAQAVAVTGARLEVRLEAGSNLLRVARLVPDYSPMDLPVRQDLGNGAGGFCVPVGALARPETVVMLEVQNAAPFGLKPGVLRVGEVSATGRVKGADVAGGPVALELEYAPSSSRKPLARVQEMENLRVAWQIAINAELREGTDDPEEKIRRTDQMIDASRRLGDDKMASQLLAQREQLARQQPLSADARAQVMNDVRRTGRLPSGPAVAPSGGDGR